MATQKKAAPTCYRPDCSKPREKGRMLCVAHEKQYRAAGHKFSNVATFRAQLGLPPQVKAARKPKAKVAREMGLSAKQAAKPIRLKVPGAIEITKTRPATPSKGGDVRPVTTPTPERVAHPRVPKQTRMAAFVSPAPTVEAIPEA